MTDVKPELGTSSIAVPNGERTGEQIRERLPLIERKLKTRHVFKDPECPANLKNSRSSPFAIVRISGALCEAIKVNQQHIIEKALEEISITELEEILGLKRLEAKQQEEG